MVQVLSAAQRSPSFSQRLGTSLLEGIDLADELMKEKRENEALEKLGIPKGLSPELRKTALTENLRGKNQQAKYEAQIKALQGIKSGNFDLSDIEEQPVNQQQITMEEPITQETQPKKKTKIKTEGPPHTPQEIQDAAIINSTVANNWQRQNEDYYRRQEHAQKITEDRRNFMLKETADLRKQIAQKAMAATQGIQNKEHLLQLIKTGDLNDPTFAALAEALPLNLGKRLLSPETVEYKAGLIEEFGDLRNLFQGQTRIKEIDLLEQKIADLYLTDEQKEAVIRSRIKALKADQIRAEIASEMEKEEPRSVLEFQTELDKRSQIRLKSLFEDILEEQKAIIESADRRKNSDTPLDANDPDDRQILIQILNEAEGDKAKARMIAKKKGYKL